MKKMRKLLLAILGMLIFLLIVDQVILQIGNASVASTLTELSPAEAILVPGARIYAGTVSPILAERLDAAIEVLLAHKAEKILVSGDYSSRYYDEATAMKKYLVQHGVNTERILLDHAGFSTYESVIRARDMFGFSSLIIVSQDFHLPRALFIARVLGLHARGFSASKMPLGEEETFRSNWREPLARFKAIYDLLRKANPAFTGSGLPLDASGSVVRH